MSQGELDTEHLLRLITERQPIARAELFELSGWPLPKRFNAALLKLVQDERIFCNEREQHYMLPDSAPHKQYLARQYEALQIRNWLITQLGGHHELPPGYTHISLYQQLQATPQGLETFLKRHGKEINKWRNAVGKSSFNLP